MGTPKKPRQQPTQYGSNSPPAEGPLSQEAKAAIDVADEIHRTIEEDVSDSAKEKNASYFEGVGQKAESIAGTIRRNNRVSAGQRTALDNILNGVKCWVRD